MNVSSATIRNDMAYLERAGLLEQPHTSAGRIPTYEGFRYYIDNLMEARLLAPVTVTDMSGENENQMKVQFSHLTNPQNEKYFMVFTDMETMQKNINDISKICVIAVTYKDLSAMLSQPKCAMKGFVINPFTENIICGPQQAEVIANYIRQKKFNSGELTVINEVTGVPDTVTKPITSYFDSRKDIKKAYIMNMRKVNQLNRLIIVDFEGEDDKFDDFTKDFTEKVLKLSLIHISEPTRP